MSLTLGREGGIAKPLKKGGLYQWALTQQNQRFEDRERLNSELFGVYIDGRNRTDALIEKNNTDLSSDSSLFYLSKF